MYLFLENFYFTDLEVKEQNPPNSRFFLISIEYSAADINEWTPIHAASAFGYLDIVELFVPLVTDGVLIP